MVKVIGLTGSIAVGKSTVTARLRELGYQVVDADVLARDAIEKGTKGYDQIRDEFGCIDESGQVDRKKLGDIVFHDKEMKNKLENIIHPFVIENMQKSIDSCHDSLIFLDIPLLYETHLDKMCDSVIVVYVNEEIQVKRLMNRNHITKEKALHLMKQQMSIEIKKQYADYIIDNSLGVNELYQEINRVLGVLEYEIIHE